MNDAQLLLAEWRAHASRDVMNARLQSIALEHVRVEALGIMGGVASAPTVEVYAGQREGSRLHVFFLFDFQFYHYAQSGSDWDTHSVVAGDATFDGDELVAHALKTAKHTVVHEVKGSTAWHDERERNAVVSEVRDALRAQMLEDDHGS